MGKHFYQRHVEEILLPFWNRALDHRYGGIYTCFDNSGARLISTNKYTWSQGRFLWVWSHVARQIAEGKLNGEVEPYHEQIHRTARFLEQHVFLDNGNCAFLLSESGEKLESIPGEGFDTSFYADCFVVIGMAAYAGLFYENQKFEKALGLYFRIEERLKAGEIKSEPYPVPAGYKAFSVPMIMLNVVQELADVAAALNHPEQERLFQASLCCAQSLMDGFCLKSYRMAEMLPEARLRRHTLLARHVNPGHTIEAMWFVMHTAHKAGKYAIIEKATRVIRKAFETGWDPEFGGILHYADKKGGKPSGEAGGSAYEKSVLGTWDTKLWWVHSEALYATMLGAALTGNRHMRLLHDKVQAYTFSTFPNPDKAVGEWVQIRDRRGNPLDKVVALPVKDPFHILRSMLLILDLPSKV